MRFRFHVCFTYTSRVLRLYLFCHVHPSIVENPMALACLVRVPFDEESTEWSPGAFLRNPFFQVPRWITRGQVRARARYVRFLLKLLSKLDEDVQATVVSFFWQEYRNPWDSLLA